MIGSILSLSSRLNNRDDIILWMLENDGSFLVKSSPKLVVKEAALTRKNSDLVWKANYPEKFKVFL